MCVVDLANEPENGQVIGDGIGCDGKRRYEFGQYFIPGLPRSGVYRGKK